MRVSLSVIAVALWLSMASLADAQAPLQSTPPIAVAAGSAEPGYLGLVLKDSPWGTGPYVAWLYSGAPADQAQVRAGDAVRALNGRSVRSRTEFAQIMGQVPAGSAVALDVTRNGQPLSITITAARKPLANTLASAPVNTSVARTANYGTPPGLGVQTAVVTAELQASLRLPDTRGAYISAVYTGSAAHRAGLPVQSVVNGFNGREILAPDDLRNAIIGTELNRPVLITYYYGGQQREANVTLTTPLPQTNAATAQRPLSTTPATQDAYVYQLQQRVADLERQLRDMQLRQAQLPR